MNCSTRIHPAIGRGVSAWRAVRAELDGLTAGQGELIEHRERSWASITFAGTRHTAVLAFDGAEAVERGEHLIAELPEHLFDIPGHLVADAAVVEADHRLTHPPRLVVALEVLLLEDS